MYVALVVIYVVICFFLILVVLLQQGKGADIAGAFGGGGSQTAFGARGATTFLHKLTTGAFVGFIAALGAAVDHRGAAANVGHLRSLPAAAPAKTAPRRGASGGSAPALPARPRRRARSGGPPAARHPGAPRSRKIVPRAVVVELVDTYV